MTDEQESIETLWRTMSALDLQGFLPKWEEYGSQDLAEIGRQLVLVSGGDPRSRSREDLLELGILFYLIGKVARAIEAWRNDRKPSDDTLHDITVYSMMARLAREGKL